MKLKDLKKKLQNESYDIPDCLSKIKPQANAKQFKKEDVRKPKPSLVMRLSFVMACLILVFFTSILFFSNKGLKTDQSLEYEVALASSSEKIKTILNYNVYRSSSNKTIGCAKKLDTAQPTINYSNTNIQVAGVNEDDVVKTDGDYLYNIYANEITIYDFTSGNIEYSKTLTLSSDMNYTTGTLQVTDDYLIAIYDLLNQKAEVVIFNKENNFDVEKTYTVDGNIIDTRLTDEDIYLVSSKTIDKDDIKEPMFTNDLDNKTIGFEKIWFVNNALNNSFIILSQINLKTLDVNQVGHIGSSPEIVYGTQNNLYFVSTRFINGISLSTIYVYSIKDELSFKGIIQEEGDIVDQYAIDEYNDTLRIFINGYSHAAKENINTSNHLFIYDLKNVSDKTKKLEKIGSLTENIGEINETIKSAYFEDNYGYVVTYYQKDPLYKINLQDPKNPKIVGRAKSDGYSNNLHKFNNNYMIGVGYDDEEMPKIALYDVESKHEQIGVNIDFKSMLKKDIIYNFKENKELFVLNDLNIIGIPVIAMYDYDEYDTEVLIFKVNEEKVNRYKEFIETNNIMTSDYYLNFSKQRKCYELYEKTEGGWMLVQPVADKDLESFKKSYMMLDFDITESVLDLVVEITNDKFSGYEISRFSAPAVNRERISNEEFENTCYKYELRRVVYINGYYVGVTSYGISIYNQDYQFIKTIYAKKEK